MNKPNHICKNPKCQKHYYFCDGCNVNKKAEWGKVGCCKECAEIYWRLIKESRKEDKPEIQIEDKTSEEITIKTRKPRAKKETTETEVNTVESEE